MFQNDLKHVMAASLKSWRKIVNYYFWALERAKRVQQMLQG
jgi:hypothetical protein